MSGRRSLRARLLIGLLVVTATGLLVTLLVSFLTLRAFVTTQLDDQLELTAERAMARLDQGTPPVGVDAPSPSPYFVVLVNPSTGDVDRIFGDAEREDVVLERIAEVPIQDLRRYAQTREIFELDEGQSTVPPHRATIRRRDDSLVISGVPTDEREVFTQQLVWTQLGTAVVLLTGLTLAGRWLITRGLEPLDRMASTANRIGTGSDLGARMPTAESDSEVGRLAQAINTMLGRLERAFHAQRASEERIRAFAADASHELRTPLTSIRGYAELYRQGAVGPGDVPETIGRIEAEAERMSRLVNELLELARLDQGSSLHPRECDLAAIVRDMAADARAVEPQRVVDLHAPPQLTWEVDETRFRQILANLLANVREHTPPECRVAIEVREEPEPSEWGARDDEASPDQPRDSVVALEVSDTGPGMPADDVARAFDRFHRGQRAPGGGSGLGLAIVWASATAHGGDVRLDSTPGSGTTVTVRLPRHPRSAQPPLDTESPTPPEAQ
ncbi:HAMP domain-containing sensor histidine kinase [Lipingzhangella sp. LS1_29]|uniref:histidine kinase n=1 Tax=Lipingzhangella rawalii TaxID=2055835 RepID=A0ABU2H5Z7_9ACTN|nr:HAMP domain-containing sensor histidine kinase [Lipingzhangella rawalii]MDS1270285.1 HAMP domain-containing sensor histidine kinase [Lipingzhangella rawalii]